MRGPWGRGIFLSDDSFSLRRRVSVCASVLLTMVRGDLAYAFRPACVTLVRCVCIQPLLVQSTYVFGRGVTIGKRSASLSSLPADGLASVRVCARISTRR